MVGETDVTWVGQTADASADVLADVSVVLMAAWLAQTRVG